MSIKQMIFAAAVVATVALPGAASAQYYGGNGYGYGNGYYGQTYRDRDYRDQDRFDRHDRHRWEQRRRWEERQRRLAWERAHRFHDRYGYDRDYYRY